MGNRICECFTGKLAATIKEPFSIYFVKNPHDGLLETNNVDKCLEGKLKCLIFIPILSQTYCDPKSFAWQHESCVFNKLAQTDQFGRDVKVISGNVLRFMNWICDRLAIENEIGGALKAIEFIFKSTDVNRPLTRLTIRTSIPLECFLFVYGTAVSMTWVGAVIWWRSID